MSLQLYRDFGVQKWSSHIKAGMFDLRDTSLFGTEFEVRHGPGRNFRKNVISIRL